jgi:hypothetical protein
MRVRSISAVCLGVLALVLAGCSDHAPSQSVPGTITGVVTAPNPAQFASTRSGGFLTRLASLLVSAVYADVTGVAPVANATVELVRLDSAGNVVALLAQTTTDSTGTYTFTNTPALADSSLAVRVVGQIDTMRAFVTGRVVNISPVTEVVMGAVLNSLGASVLLQNFEIEEIAALNSVLQGMDRDISGLSFSDAVTAIQNDASSPLFTQLLADFSTPGVSTALRGGYYGIVDMRTVLRDPHVLPSAGSPKGIEIDSGQGNLIFPSGDDRPSPGVLAYGAFLHNLTSVSDLGDPTLDNAFPFGLSLGDLLHVATTRGQLVLADTADPSVTAAGIGAVTADGSLMVYPVDASVRVNSQLSWFGMGLRFAARSFQPNGTQTPMDLTLLDKGGGGTAYHEVSLKEVLSGLVQGSGTNAVTLTTKVGSVTYDSTPVSQTFDETKKYGSFSENVTTDSLAINLADYTVSQTNGSESRGGLYYVFANNGLVQFRDASTGYPLGHGSTPEDGVRNGEVIGSHQFSGGFDSPVSQVQRTYSIAIRTTSGLANGNVSGTYNLIQYAGYLSTATSPPDGVVETGIRYGTLSLNGSGTVTGGNLYHKRAGMGLAEAAATAFGGFAGSDFTAGIHTICNGCAVPNASGTSGAFTNPVAGAGGEIFKLQVVNGSNVVTLFSSTSVQAGDQITAGDIDNGIRNHTADLPPGITYAGTVSGGDLVFTKADGSAFDIVVTDTFSTTLGGFAGTDFAVGTNTINHGSTAPPNTSGQSGTFTPPTATSTGETFALGVGGVTVFSFTSTAAGQTVQAGDIDAALGTATVQNNLAAAGVTFTGTVANGDLSFTKTDGTEFAIGVENGFTTPALSSSAGQETVSGGTYSVGADGSLTLSLTIGSESLTGNGAVTHDGDFAALAITTHEGTRSGRGMLVLVRQP